MMRVLLLVLMTQLARATPVVFSVTPSVGNGMTRTYVVLNGVFNQIGPRDTWHCFWDEREYLTATYLDKNRLECGSPTDIAGKTVNITVQQNHLNPFSNPVQFTFLPLGSQTPSPTPSATPVATPSPTKTPTKTPTSTPTPSRTPSASVTPSRTPTATATAWPSRTPSATPTPSASSTIIYPPSGLPSASFVPADKKPKGSSAGKIAAALIIVIVIVVGGIIGFVRLRNRRRYGTGSSSSSSSSSASSGAGAGSSGPRAYSSVLPDIEMAAGPVGGGLLESVPVASGAVTLKKRPYIDPADFERSWEMFDSTVVKSFSLGSAAQEMDARLENSNISVVASGLSDGVKRAYYCGIDTSTGILFLVQVTLDVEMGEANMTFKSSNKTALDGFVHIFERAIQ